MNKDEVIGEVDLDKSTIKIEQEWMTKKQIKSTMKSRIESGDFDVTIYANALKKLEHTLNALEEVQLRIPITVLDAYKNLAESRSTSVESCLRKGVTEYLVHNDKLQPLKDTETPKNDKSKKKGKGK